MTFFARNSVKFPSGNVNRPGVEKQWQPWGGAGTRFYTRSKHGKGWINVHRTVEKQQETASQWSGDIARQHRADAQRRSGGGWGDGRRTTRQR